jgi:hypothetical protein
VERVHGGCVCCRGGFLSETPSGRREEEEKEIICLSVSEEYLPEMRKSHPESEWERKSDMAGKEQLIA